MQASLPLSVHIQGVQINIFLGFQVSVPSPCRCYLFVLDPGPQTETPCLPVASPLSLGLDLVSSSSGFQMGSWSSSWLKPNNMTLPYTEDHKGLDTPVLSSLAKWSTGNTDANLHCWVVLSVASATAESATSFSINLLRLPFLLTVHWSPGMLHRPGYTDSTIFTGFNSLD